MGSVTLGKLQTAKLPGLSGLVFCWLRLTNEMFLEQRLGTTTKPKALTVIWWARPSTGPQLVTGLFNKFKNYVSSSSVCSYHNSRENLR
jgi:hypothetical protein